MGLQTHKDIEARRKTAEKNAKAIKRRIMVCAGTGCVAHGSMEVYDKLLKAAKEAKLPVVVELGHHEKDAYKGAEYIATSGCHGFCQIGPLIHIMPDDILYCHVKPKDVSDIVEKTLKGGEVIDKLLYKEPNTKERKKGRADIPFYAGQHRIALRRCGEVDPESLDAYLADGGFAALEKALFELTPKKVLKEVDDANLRGRGGAGFPAGRKWRSCIEAEGDERFVICNGDEGDPGAFMDRSIMEGDPYAVIEGLMLAAYVVGAKQGYIYVRHEYPLAVSRITKAIETMREEGLLGEDILGSAFSFDIQINRGGGAFVCGESTALMRSLEGKVGEPRAKYVRSVVKGLFDKPTVLNNVETLACVPYIINIGGKAFKKTGTKTSSGTKAFSLVGKVNNTGLVEVPMGTTLREIIFEMGGGILKNRKFKAVQTGGPSGGCLPESMLDLAVDFDTLSDSGSMMGSGGMIVMDDRTCMVDVARYFIEFLIGESCGKCTPCREGLRQMLAILERICKGEGKLEDLERIERLCSTLESASLCALGKSAANPVRSTLKHFRDEYLAHIEEKRCPGGVCKELIRFDITDKCIGCTKCASQCPTNAISGERKKMHIIDQSLCIRCGSCVSVCPTDAIDIT